MTSVRIPGKVMLSGEYAVLYGGTAVLVPVDRFIVVSDAVTHAPFDSPVVEACIDLTIPELEAHPTPPGSRPQLDNSGFFHQTADGKRLKLGLGASAAEAVGIIAWRYERAGIPWLTRQEDVLTHALSAHSAAQHGLGSGADVAACCYGRPVYFKSEPDRKPEVTPVVSPSISSHNAALAWSGRNADTRLQVQRFQSWVKSGGSEARLLLSRLIEASESVARSWFNATWDELYTLLAEFVVILSRCTREAGIPYKTEEHRQIESWAIRHGGKAKPVGAGAGDMVLLLGELPIEELDCLVIPIRI